MVAQRGEAWVKAASPEQINTALKAGELASYMGGKTVEEQVHDALVAGSADRVHAAAYGLSLAQAQAINDSSFFSSKRRDMDMAQLEKLGWVESATPAEVFSAEQAGDLDHLLGRDVSAEAARLDAVRAATVAAIRGANK
jgi:hypothetical protein